MDRRPGYDWTSQRRSDSWIVNNTPAICMSIRDAAKGLIKGGVVNDGLLNMVEMTFRAYDPCFGCATHFAVGQMPLEVAIYDQNKNLLKTVKR